MKRALAGVGVLLAVAAVLALVFSGGERPAEKRSSRANGARRFERPRVTPTSLRPRESGRAVPAATNAEAVPAAARKNDAKPRATAPQEEDGPEAADFDHKDGAGAGVDVIPGIEAKYRENLERSKAIIARGPSEVLATLRGSDRELARTLADALLDDDVALCDRDLIDGLWSCGADTAANAEDRTMALELLGRSAGTDTELLAKVAKLSVEDPDSEIRVVATGAIRQLALEREDLVSETRAALVDAAEKATSSELRGDALSSIHAENASEKEIDRIARFLADPDPSVRVSAGIALLGADPGVRGKVLAAVEAAFAKESDVDAASTLAVTALRVGRGDAAPLLEQLARSDVALQHPEVARQLQDYRSLLAEGESDPVKIDQIHQEREDARVAGGADGPR